MPSRFATSGDYSQTFQSLYYQNTASLEAGAARVDAEREAEQASKDALVFTRWQEGKISGGELMAYINSRMRQTSYDKEQQNKWREAAITYGTQIADDRAEAAYAQSGNINALIGHYAARLGAASKGTPEYLELTQRLKSLTEQRDADSLRKQSKRIARAIERGDKTNKDLLAFYRESLKGMSSNSPLREGVLDAISELRTKMRDEQFQVGMQTIDSQLATGQISPADAAAMKEALLVKFDVQTIDPVEYAGWIEQIRVLKATPSPAEISQLEFELATGAITNEQYQAKIEEFANRIEPFDQAAAWQLRIEAQKVSDENALADPGALGLPSGAQGFSGGGMDSYSGTIEVVRRLTGNAIRQISQLDGSAYSQYNCTMAAGAMLAYSMGARGLSGADLRYLSGVTSAATNVQQLQYALEKAGVDGTKLNWDSRIEFEQFKQRLANGSTAVLSGWLGDIPAQLNTSGQIAGHAMFAASYDPKRDAFLMLDPAKSSDKGTWWPADIVENFGWGGERYGQALLSPRGTVDPATLKLAGGNIQHISVNAKAKLSSTPPGYEGQYSPGPDAANKIREAEVRRMTADDRRLQRRLEKAGIEVGPALDTRQEVEAELVRRRKSYTELDDKIDEWVALYAENGEDVQDVVIGGEHIPLSRDDIAGMQKELLFLYDGQELLYTAVGDDASVAEMRKLKAEVVTQGVGINSIERTSAMGRLEREVNGVFKSIPKMQDPAQIRTALEDAAGLMEQLSAVESSATTDPDAAAREKDMTQVELQAEKIDSGAVAPEVQAQEAFYANALAISLDKDMTRDQRVEALLDLGDQFDVAFPKGWPDGDTIDIDSGDPQGQIAAQFMQRFDEISMLDERDEFGLPLGQAILIHGELAIVPTVAATRKAPNPDGVGLPVDVPVRYPVLEVLSVDIQKEIAKLGYDAKTLPVMPVPAIGGGKEMRAFLPEFVPYTGITYLKWGKLTPAQLASLPPELQAAYKKTVAGQENMADQPLDDATLSIFDGLQNYVDFKQRGIVEEQAFWVEAVEVQDIDGKGSSVWFKDAGDNRWHEGNLPFIGRSPASLRGPFGSDYVGMRVEGGRPWPELELAISDMDPATLGLPTPVPGGMPVEKAGEFIRDEQSKGLVIDPLKMRSANDGSVIQYTPDSPEYVSQWERGDLTIQDAIATAQRNNADAMDKLATVLPPNEAADTVFWDEQEKRVRSRAMGIDYDTGQWVSGSYSRNNLPQPSQAILDELGITVPAREGPPAQKPVSFNPLDDALRAKGGVAAANKAERDRKRAETASQATVTSVLPKITTPYHTTIVPPVSQPIARTSTVPKVVTPVAPVPVGASPVTTAPAQTGSNVVPNTTQGRTTYLGGGR